MGATLALEYHFRCVLYKSKKMDNLPCGGQNTRTGLYEVIALNYSYIFSSVSSSILKWILSILFGSYMSFIIRFSRSVFE